MCARAKGYTCPCRGSRSQIRFWLKNYAAIVHTTFMVAELGFRSQAPAHLNVCAYSPHTLSVSRALTAMDGPFVGGIGQMEVLQAAQNAIATGAAVATVVRVLAPKAGRFVWHLWNKATGEVKPVEDAVDVVVTDELMEILEKPSDPRPQSTPETPSGPGKRNRISPFYSQEPMPQGNLLKDLNAAKKGSDTAIASTTTCQFGPTTHITDGNDYSNNLQLQQDIDKGKLHSIQDGKGGVGNGGNGVGNGGRQKTWQLDDDNVLNHKTINARFARMEEELQQLGKEKATWQQQPVQQQTNVLMAAMDTPKQQTIIVKDIMSNVQKTTIVKDRMSDLQKTTTKSIRSITNGVFHRNTRSPDSDDSPDGGDSGNGINNLNSGNANNPNGDDGDDGDDSGGTNTTIRAGGRFDERGREFSLVKSSNIIIQVFSGKNLNNNPYLPFNKSLKRLIYNHGADGEQLLEILEGVEKYGSTKFDNDKLKLLLVQYPKVAEYNRAIKSSLLNYTTSIAKGMVEYGVDNGFDAWRRLYNHYILLADDLKKDNYARALRAEARQ